MSKEKYIVVVLMFQDVVQSTSIYDLKNKKKAIKQFETWTGVSYLEYITRKTEGEADDEILGEDYAGTEIYVNQINSTGDDIVLSDL